MSRKRLEYANLASVPLDWATPLVKVTLMSTTFDPNGFSLNVPRLRYRSSCVIRMEAAFLSQLRKAIAKRSFPSPQIHSILCEACPARIFRSIFKNDILDLYL